MKAKRVNYVLVLTYLSYHYRYNAKQIFYINKSNDNFFSIIAKALTSTIIFFEKMPTGKH